MAPYETRTETCDGWFVQERSPGRLWHVTRDAWDEDENPIRPRYYADIQLDPRLSCEHQKWYLARWTPDADAIMLSPEPHGDWPYYNLHTFTLEGRFEDVDSALSAVVTANFYNDYRRLWLKERERNQHHDG